MDKYSVLTSIYLGSRLVEVRLAINSVLEQLSDLAELVLVIDGPIAPEMEEYVVKLVGDLGNQLVLVQLDKNYGLWYALNSGLKSCSHDIIVRMDTDDLLFPNRFEIQLAYMRNNREVDVVGMDIIEFSDSTVSLGRRRSSWNNYFGYLLTSPVFHPTVAFRKKKIVDVGGYPNVFLREDTALWLKCKRAGYNISLISVPGVYFRVSDGQIERRRGFKYFVSDIKLFWSRIMAFPQFSVCTLLVYLTVLPILRLIPLKGLTVMRESLKNVGRR